MADRRSVYRSWSHGLAAGMQPHVRLGGLIVLAAAPLFLVAAFVPRSLFLPSVALAALGAAATTAFIAWWSRARRQGQTITLWDLAGACTLIGCAAAMLSEPETVITTIGRNSEP